MRLRPWWIFLLAIVVTVAVYAPGLSGGWLFDDYPNIVDNKGVQPSDASVASLVGAALSSPSSSFKRPLASLTFAANYLAGGLDPIGWKIVNIAIHLGNGVLAFWLLGLIFRALRERGRGVMPDTRADGVMAALVAGAWLVLPINLTAVLYIVQRMESLANLFVLLGLVGYVAARRRMLAGRGGLARAAASLVLGTLAGLTAKETAVMLPLYAFLVEWLVFGFRRGPMSAHAAAVGESPIDQHADCKSAPHKNEFCGGRTCSSPVLEASHDTADGKSAPRAAATRPMLEASHDRADGKSAPRTAATRPMLEASHDNADCKSAPHQAAQSSPHAAERDRRLMALFGVLLWLPMLAGLAWLLPRVLRASTWATRDFALGTRLLSEARIVTDYVAWTLVPLPQWLSFYHDDFVVSQGLLAPWTTLLSVLVIVALLWLAWWQRRRQPLVALGLAWFFACQLLTATILPLELIYEHRNYFASLGLLLAVVPLLVQPGAWRFLRGAVLVALAAWWLVLTGATAYAWGDPLRLAATLADRAPDSPRAQYEYGRTLLIDSNYDPASPFTPLVYAPLERAAALPRSSILPQQALLFFNARLGRPMKDAWWNSLIAKLKARKPGVQDESSLAAMGKCAATGACPFDQQRMVAAFEAAMSHPNPSARLLSTYANYAWNVLGHQQQAFDLTQRAIRAKPDEPAYRVTLARMAAIMGRPDVIRVQLQQLQRLNYGGRLDHDIAGVKALLGSVSGAVP